MRRNPLTSPAAGGRRRRRGALAALTGAVLMAGVLLPAPTASAGRRPGSGTAITVPDGVYGGTTTATVSKPPAGTWVVSTCYQDGSPVIFNRLEADAQGQAVLTLGPTEGYVSGIGGADCTAEAKYWNLKRQRWVSLGTTSFQVAD